MISITQEQKEFIESQGFMVIQFKAWCRCVTKVVIDVFDAIMEWIRDMVNKVRECLRPLISELASKRFEPRRKYKICKRLGVDYRPFIPCTVYYHNCRDNC